MVRRFHRFFPPFDPEQRNRFSNLAAVLSSRQLLLQRKLLLKSLRHFKPTEIYRKKLQKGSHKQTSGDPRSNLTNMASRFWTEFHFTPKLGNFCKPLPWMFQSWSLGSIVVSSGFEEMPASERTSRLSISILQKIPQKHSRTGLICLSLTVFVSPWFLLSLILPTSLQVSIRVFSKHTFSNFTSSYSSSNRGNEYLHHQFHFVWTPSALNQD